MFNVDCNQPPLFMCPPSLKKIASFGKAICPFPSNSLVVIIVVFTISISVMFFWFNFKLLSTSKVSDPVTLMDGLVPSSSILKLLAN